MYEYDPYSIKGYWAHEYRSLLQFRGNHYVQTDVIYMDSVISSIDSSD
jgi:hypothetical protein